MLLLVFEGSFSRDDVAWVCANVARNFPREGAGHEVVCDVARLTRPDAVVVDGLARLQLAARRSGSRVVLRGASQHLQSLLALTGLTDVVPVCPEQSGSGGEVVGEAEVREEPGVEEVRDPDDPPL
jgi:ABC-type transporter Mla MlaB component